MATTEQTIPKTGSPFAGMPDIDGEPLPGEAEPEDDDGTPAPDPEGNALFDRSSYEREDLAIAKVDGQQIDKIAVKFTGRILLDRSAPADVALYNSLQMGADVELRCAGKVTSTGAGWTTNREGDLDAIVGEKAVKVETVWVLTPEQL
jgi:hypothetical protein